MPGVFGGKASDDQEGSLSGESEGDRNGVSDRLPS